MDTDTLQTERPAAVCPFHAASADAGSGESRTLEPTDVLHLPLHQRMVTQRATGEDGQPELRLFYADKEISFDEPELFTFGETLARQTSFTAADTLGWGSPGDWPRMRELLQQLIDEGVLRQADDGIQGRAHLMADARQEVGSGGSGHFTGLSLHALF